MCVCEEREREREKTEHTYLSDCATTVNSLLHFKHHRRFPNVVNVEAASTDYPSGQRDVIDRDICLGVGEYKFERV